MKARAKEIKAVEIDISEQEVKRLAVELPLYDVVGILKEVLEKDFISGAGIPPKGKMVRKDGSTYYFFDSYADDRSGDDFVRYLTKDESEKFDKLEEICDSLESYLSTR